MWRKWFLGLSWSGVGLAAEELVFGAVSLLFSEFFDETVLEPLNLLIANSIAIGLPLAAGMAAWTLVLLCTRRRELAGILLVCAGHLLTLAFTTATTVWALTAKNGTGWELLNVPFAVLFGQCFVAAGLGWVRFRDGRGAAEQR